jgi:hypothetical protein
MCGRAPAAAVRRLAGEPWRRQRHHQRPVPAQPPRVAAGESVRCVLRALAGAGSVAQGASRVA